MAEERKYNTLVHARMVRHKYKGKEYGLWVRLQKLLQLLPGTLVPRKMRRVPLGIASNRRVIVALQRPSRIRSTPEMAANLADDRLWCGTDVPSAVRWIGDCTVRREERYLGRVYIPKSVLKLLDTTDLNKAITATLWHLPPSWIILDVSY